MSSSNTVTIHDHDQGKNITILSAEYVQARLAYIEEENNKLRTEILSIRIKMGSDPNWEWFGHAGHFIGSPSCRFRLHTLVGNGRFVVSTIGELYPGDSEEMMRLGADDDGFFETMVFPASGKLHECGCPVIEDLTGLDIWRYATPMGAQAGHLAACHEWHEKKEIKR